MGSKMIGYMREAIDQARLCRPEDPSKPLVGAVLVEPDGTVHAAHRGEDAPGDHAEFTLLQKRLRSRDLTKNATLITTLEPCTTRSHDKKPCASWILHKGIRRVLIGLLDPNPSICGRGYWQLVRNGVEVEFFPWDLVAEVKQMNQAFVEHHQRTAYSDALSLLVQRHKGRYVSRYNLLAWGDAVSVLDSPRLRDGGWPASVVRLEHREDAPFVMPQAHHARYSQYREQNYQVKRFYDDGEKFVLARNPTAFTDSDTLTLETRATRYSELMYYRDQVATDAFEKDRLIEDFLSGSLDCGFAHGFNLQLVVATSDDRVLLTKRSPKVAFFPNSWSCSLEETLSASDVAQGPEATVRTWFARALEEELGVSGAAYHVDNLRVLSVFLESDFLNLNLCGYATLDAPWVELDRIIKAHPRPDTEFVAWRDVALDQGALLEELVHPQELQHPTTGYRLLMSILKNFGAPTMKELAPYVADFPPRVN
jgi:pyrimidine deaminase RibD-like protein